MNEDLKVKTLNFLKSFTRLIVQTNLYNSSHPQVKEAVNESLSNLNLLLENSKEFNLTIQENKLLINGENFAQADKLPNSFLNIFKKTNIDTIIFKNNITMDELINLPKILSSKNPIDIFLKENNINNIILKKSIYVKDGSKIKNENKETKDIKETLKDKKFEDSLKEIVSRLTNNEKEQEEIINTLLEKFKKEVEIKINQAIEEINKERIKIENDYKRTASVISSIAEGIINVDKNGNIMMMNPEAQNIAGKPLKDLAGKKITEYIKTENHLINLAEELKTEKEKPINEKIQINGDDKIKKIIKNSTAIIKNEEGKIVGTISVPTDITKLNEIDKLKDDFISTMTHELRSPLTSIKMALDLISKEKLSKENINMLNSAIRNSERLNSIISDMLDFSKLQSGKMIFNLNQISPDEIIKSSIESMNAWANSKNIKINSLLEENIPSVYADLRRSEQILINLLSNSLKLTPNDGKIEIKSYRGKDASTSNFVFFSVTDTGPGIKKEDIPKLFEKFVQAANGEKVGGTGLGLAITKAMVVMQGGQIFVESEYTKGATFTFSLPVYRISENNESKNLQVKNIPWWKKILRIK